MSLLEKLFKSKQEIEQNGAQEIEKSFDEALDELNKAMAPRGEAAPVAGEEEEGEEEEAPKKKKKFSFRRRKEEEEDEEDVGKSESSEVESGEEEIYVDAEPIIKSMMEEIHDRLDAIDSRIGVIEKVQKAHADLAVSEAKILKSLDITGKTPVERKGIVNAQERPFTKSGDERKLTKAQATEKLQQLIKANKISSQEVAIIEGRITSGAELPEIMFEEIK